LLDLFYLSIFNLSSYLKVSAQLSVYEVPAACKGQLRKGIFERNNYYRALHNVPSLAMSTNLTTLAQLNATSNIRINYKGFVLPTNSSSVSPNSELVFQNWVANVSSLANSTYCYGKYSI